MWSLIGLFALLRNIFPAQFLHFFHRWRSSAQELFSPYYYLDIPQLNGNSGANANEAYRNVGLYLASLDTTAGARTLTAFAENELGMVELCPDSDVEDSFNGATVWWSHHVQPLVGSDGRTERRWFTLKIAKGSTHLLSAYFDYIANLAAEFKRLNFPCTFSQFKSLAFNYLQIEEHALFAAVEETMKERGAQITPAEISEILINNSDDPLKALNAVISALNKNMTEIHISTDFQQHNSKAIQYTAYYEEGGGQILEEEEIAEEEECEITGQYC